MPRHHPSKTLAQILDIRVVQRQAAQAQVVRAAERLDAAERERDAAGERLEIAEGRWRESLSGPSMALHLMGALSTEILVEAEGVVRADSDVAAAEKHKDQTRDHWRSALTSEDAAKALTRSARRAEIRRADEAALNDLADRFAHQGAVR